MNIYLRELKSNRKSLIIWSVSMLFLILASMIKYSAGVDTGSGNLNDIMEKMPTSLQNLFGVGVFDLSKAIDYFGVLFMYIALVAAVHAVMLGASIISKEERDKTVEFLMVKPVSRQTIMTSKLLASLTTIVIFNIITYISSYFMLCYYSKEEPFGAKLFYLMIGMLALQILFTAIGAFFAALIAKPKLSSALATGILMLMFMLAIIVDISGKIDFLKYVSFFKYYDAKDLLFEGYNFAYPIISVVMVVGLIYATYFFYQKRDLSV